MAFLQKMNRFDNIDCIEGMKAMPENSVDAIVTDPPYGLEFMGKEWDKLEPARNQQRWKDTERVLIKPAEFKDFKALPTYKPKRNAKCKVCNHYKFSGTPCKCEQPDWDNREAEYNNKMQQWHFDWATEALRVLKPGGFLLAFGGTRTCHRLTCAIEDAGFEIRDMYAWLYGSGFPKSTKPKNGMLSLPRSTTRKEYKKWWLAVRTYSTGTAVKPAIEPITVARKPLSEKTVASNVLKWGTGGINIDDSRVGTESTIRKNHTAGVWSSEPQENVHGSEQGRFPANLIHDGSDEVEALFPQTGISGKGGGKPGGWQTDFVGGRVANEETYRIGHNDNGSASRFFYVAKASKADRNNRHSKNTWVTVKPVKLMEYLIKLVTPKGGTVLDPFVGSGTTLLAAEILGFDCIGFEKDKEAYQIATDRLKEYQLKLAI